MKNILLLFLMAVCLAWCDTAQAQDADGVITQGKGWVLKANRTFKVTSDYDGEYLDPIVYSGLYSAKRFVIEEGVTSTENWKLGNLFENCKLYSISFPKSLKRVSGLNYDAVGERHLIKTDTVFAPWRYPVEIESEVFLRYPYPLLLVPSDCGYDYRHSDWSRCFAVIGIKGGSPWPSNEWSIIWREDWSVDSNGRLSVSKDYQWSNGPEFWAWPRVSSSIHGIELEEGIKIVGNNAFRQLSARTLSVVLPESVEIIGDSAFYGLTSYQEGGINLPDGLKRIGKGAFANTKIPYVIFPESLDSIGEGVFQGASISSVTLPKGLKYIGNDAFRGKN